MTTHPAIQVHQSPPRAHHPAREWRCVLGAMNEYGHSKQLSACFGRFLVAFSGWLRRFVVVLFVSSFRFLLSALFSPVSSGSLLCFGFLARLLLPERNGDSAFGDFGWCAAQPFTAAQRCLYLRNVSFVPFSDLFPLFNRASLLPFPLPTLPCAWVFYSRFFCDFVMHSRADLFVVLHSQRHRNTK